MPLKRDISTSPPQDSIASSVALDPSPPCAHHLELDLLRGRPLLSPHAVSRDPDYTCGLGEFCIGPSLRAALNAFQHQYDWPRFADGGACNVASRSEGVPTEEPTCRPMA